MRQLGTPWWFHRRSHSCHSYHLQCGTRSHWPRAHLQDRPRLIHCMSRLYRSPREQGGTHIHRVDIRLWDKLQRSHCMSHSCHISLLQHDIHSH
jgi:hypothetical protein